MVCLIHRAECRCGGIRIGEGSRFVHINFEPIQFGNGVHGGRINVGSRRFPTQRPRGKRDSGVGRRWGPGI